MRPRPHNSRRGGTWRPAPGDRPASYATSLAFELARLNGRSPAEVGRRILAAPLRGIAWIEAADPSGDGYLTITVTPQALASVGGPDGGGWPGLRAEHDPARHRRDGAALA